MDKNTCCICGQHIGRLDTFYKPYRRIYEPSLLLLSRRKA